MDDEKGWPGRSMAEPNRDVERRLRAVFSNRRMSSYGEESTNPVIRREANGMTGELDAERLCTAIRQLRLLVNGSTTALRDSGDLARVTADVDIAIDTAAAMVRHAAPPRESRLPFVAELMVISDGTRPAGLIRDGRVLSPSAMGDFRDIYLGFLPEIERTISATGRLLHAGRHVGSGVLVEVGRAGTRHLAVLTARHVIEACPAGTVAIDFRGEVGASSSARFALGGPVHVGKGPAPHGDHCLLPLDTAIDGTDLPQPARLDLDAKVLDPPGWTAVVSYPGRPATDIRALVHDDAWERVFEGLWHVKRLSPARLHDSGDPALAHHDATTTGGSSGGAMASVGKGRVAGIHLGGADASRNEGLRLFAIANGWTA